MAWLDQKSTICHEAAGGRETKPKGFDMSVTIENEPNVVVAKDIHVAYSIGKHLVSALRGVDLDIQKGEFVALMGPSGCGKSTLLHVIGGLLKPNRGRIFIEGIEIGSISDAVRTKVRRDRMGFVFQKYNLLASLTAWENIELAQRIRGNGHYEERGVYEILRLLGLEGKTHHKPSELSGGEQQRVAIARAVINHPSILLADEPTGNLDSHSSHMVLNMLKDLNLNHRQTIVMVTHDCQVASTADRIIKMCDGNVL